MCEDAAPALPSSRRRPDAFVAHVPERVSLPRHFTSSHAARAVDDDPTELIPVSVIRGRRQHRHRVRDEDPVTEPLTVPMPRVPVSVETPDTDPIPVIHNRFHVAAGYRLRALAGEPVVPDVLAKFGITGAVSTRRNRHYRHDPDDTDRIGRHSYRG